VVKTRFECGCPADFDRCDRSREVPKDDPSRRGTRPDGSGPWGRSPGRGGKRSGVQSSGNLASASGWNIHRLKQPVAVHLFDGQDAQAAAARRDQLVLVVVVRGVQRKILRRDAVRAR
jgi:hypothetical protein